jgi:hypothetical protein
MIFLRNGGDIYVWDIAAIYKTYFSDEYSSNGRPLFYQSNNFKNTSMEFLHNMEIFFNSLLLLKV